MSVAPDRPGATYQHRVVIRAARIAHVTGSRKEPTSIGNRQLVERTSITDRETVRITPDRVAPGHCNHIIVGTRSPTHRTLCAQHMTAPGHH